MKIKNYFKFIIILLLTSCAGQTPLLVLTRPPKAKVSAYNPQLNKFVYIGETPLSIKKKKVKKILEKSGDFVALKIEKSGYIIEHLLYDLTSKPKIEYRVELKKIEAWSDTESEVTSKLANDVAKKIQKVNRDIIRRDLKSAIKKTNDLIELYPKAYVFL